MARVRLSIFIIEIKIVYFVFSLLHTAIDSKGEGEGPVYNYRPFVAPFFITFIIVKYFILL
jgi:hypothetical protein